MVTNMSVIPNPFNTSLSITYSLPSTSNISLAIHELLGNRVATLVNKRKPVGNYTVQWDATNIPAESISSG